jgi:hypothetical protein
MNPGPRRASRGMVESHLDAATLDVWSILSFDLTFESRDSTYAVLRLSGRLGGGCHCLLDSVGFCPGK